MNFRLIALLCCLLLIGGGAWYVYTLQQTPVQSPSEALAQVPQPVEASTTQPALQARVAAATSGSVVAASEASTTTQDAAVTHPGMELYRNPELGFELWYPVDWNLDTVGIFSTDIRSPQSGTIHGTEVEFEASPTCHYPACEKDYPRQNVAIQVFPASATDTVQTALTRVKGIGVSANDARPLVVGGVPFDQFNINESTIDNAWDTFVEPAKLTGGRLYIISCDTVTGKHMVFDDCNMNAQELTQFLAMFSFLRD